MVAQSNTNGVEDMMQRPGLVNRVMMATVEWVEGLNRRYATMGDKPVLATADFPWAVDIEREWKLIRAELDPLLERKDELSPFHEIIGEVASISTDDQWKTFLFTGFGATSETAGQVCPNTWRILQTIPGLKTAMFSVLEPGKELIPHRGPYNGVLRFHLGLVVPDTDPQKVGIRVGDEICSWEEGKALIFDDSFDHEAWNRSSETRVVLFVDFVKPLRFPASFLNWLLLQLAPFTPFIREGAKAQKRWEAGFWKKATA